MVPYDFDRIENPVKKLSAFGIKRRNLNFYTDPGHSYQGSQPRQDVRHLIMVTRNGDLREVMRRMPDQPVHKQCAYWVRAIVGKHFFPDANHRTAMLTLDYLLNESGITPPVWPGPKKEVQRTIYDSKIVRRDLVDVTFENISEKDELYNVWCQHFYALFTAKS